MAETVTTNPAVTGGTQEGTSVLGREALKALFMYITEQGMASLIDAVLHHEDIEVLNQAIGVGSEQFLSAQQEIQSLRSEIEALRSKIEALHPMTADDVDTATPSYDDGGEQHTGGGALNLL